LLLGFGAPAIGFGRLDREVLWSSAALRRVSDEFLKLIVEVPTFSVDVPSFSVDEEGKFPEDCREGILDGLHVRG
jgi:hypothetical protein